MLTGQAGVKGWGLRWAGEDSFPRPLATALLSADLCSAPTLYRISSFWNGWVVRYRELPA